MYFTLVVWFFGPILFYQIQLVTVEIQFSYTSSNTLSLNELCLDKSLSDEEHIIVTISESEVILLFLPSARKNSHKSNNVPHLKLTVLLN